MARPKNQPLDPAKIGVLDQAEYTTTELAHRMQRHIDSIRRDIRDGKLVPSRIVGGSTGAIINQREALRYQYLVARRRRGPQPRLVAAH